MALDENQLNHSEPDLEEYECKYCSCRSSWHEGFVDVKSWRRGLQHVCVTCARLNNEFEPVHLKGILSILFYIGVAYYLLENILVTLSVFLAAYVFAYFAMVIHELAHFCSARALGVSVPVLSLGGGMHLKIVKIGRMFLVISASPTEGMIIPLFNTRQNYRKKLAIIVAAGPLINLVVGSLSIYLYYLNENSLSAVAGGSLFLWGIINLISGVANLFPFKTTTSLGPVESDGARLRKLRKTTGDEIDAVLAQNNLILASLESFFGNQEGALEIARAELQNSKGDKYYFRSLVSVAFINDGKYEEAISLIRQDLDDLELDPMQKATVQNNLAYALYLADEKEFIHEADVLSEEAFSVLPMIMPVRSTRGCLLIATGRVEEGVAMLTDERFETEIATHRASVHATCAMGLATLDRMTEADSHLLSARKLDPSNTQIARAEGFIRSITSDRDTG